MSHEGVVWCGPSIEGWLGAPLQAGQVGVFAILCRPIDLGSLALYAALFLVTLLLLTGFLTVPLQEKSLNHSLEEVVHLLPWCGGNLRII